MPTKILLYDLDATLQNVFQDLKEVQGDFQSLKERFSNIDINMFEPNIKGILQDLLDALNQDQKGTAAERIRNIEAQLQNLSANSLEMGNFNETFEYDADGNVIKHISTGDQEFVVDYVYKSDGSGDIESSKKTFTLEDGSTVVIQKQYTYTNGDITGIQTTTTITPPPTETPTDTPTDTPSTTE